MSEMNKVEEERLKNGDFVKHFKRELNNVEISSSSFIYIIVDMNARDADTNKRKVVYRAMYDDKQLWIRDYDDFISEVDKMKYSDVKQMYRFEKLTKEEEEVFVNNQMKSIQDGDL